MPARICTCGYIHKQGVTCPAKRRAAEQRRQQHRKSTTERGLGYKWRQIRTQVLKNNPACWLCGAPGADSVDHVIPRSRGGSLYDLQNLRPAHRTCNSARGNKPPRRTPPPSTQTTRNW